MSNNYYSGLPYSDELYHHGIKGMHWYQRRFQNADGSLTPAGRERYGSGKAKEIGDTVKRGLKKAADVTGKAAKKATEHAVKRFKMRHPSFASDEELAELKKRIDMERSYMQVKREIRDNSTAHKFISSLGDISKRAATDFATSAARNVADNMFKESKMDKEAKQKAFNAKDDLAGTFSKIADNAEQVSRNESQIKLNVDRIDKLRSDRATATFDKQKKINKKIDKLEKKNKKLNKENTKLTNDTKAREQTIDRKQATANTLYNYKWNSGKNEKGNK